MHRSPGNMSDPGTKKQKWIQRSRESERKNGGGGHNARSMPQDKPLRSRRSHSKPGNHTTLIPNFKRLHLPPLLQLPPALLPLTASLSPCFSPQTVTGWRRSAAQQTGAWIWAGGQGEVTGRRLGWVAKFKNIPGC